MCKYFITLDSMIARSRLKSAIVTLICVRVKLVALCTPSDFVTWPFFFLRSHDHLFKLVFRIKEHKVVLWKEIEDILAKSITTCLINIQQHSKDDTDALLYFCLNQNSLSGAIRSNVQALNGNPISNMVSTFMSTFHRFLSSNAEMPLNNTFEIYFHVASAKYVNRTSNRRKAIPMRSLVGANTKTTKCLLPGSLIDLPLGSPSNPDCFRNSCLVASLAYLILQLKRPDIFDKVKPIVLKRSTVNSKNEAAKLLIEEMEHFCTQQNISPRGPHEILDTIKALHHMYQVQTIVIYPMRGRKPELAMWPDKLDLTIPRFYLFVESGSNHVFIIQSLVTFFGNKRKGICFLCMSHYFTASGLVHKKKHKCKNAYCCQKCFGILENASFVKSNSEPWHYCDTKVAKNEINIVCCKCGYHFKTKQCHDNHMMYCNAGNYYWQCPCCEKSVSMRGRNVKEIEESHNCNNLEKFCPVCMSSMPQNHICPISKSTKTLIWPNLAVLDMMFQDATGAMCQMCYKLQSDYMKQHNISYKTMLECKEVRNLSCENHKSKKSSVPNLVKFCYERDRFEFNSVTFSSKGFILSVTNQCDTFHLTYCDNPLPFAQFSSRKRKRKDNMDQRKITAADCPVKQLFNYFVDKNLRNYTVLVQTNQEMLFLLEVLLDNFWQPSVVQSGRVIKKIDVSNLDISFILFENYCKGDLSCWLEQFEIERTVFYFPSLCNDPKYYGQTIAKPEFGHFQSFADTPKVLNDKMKFYDSLDSTINVNSFMYKCLSENLMSFLLCIAKFVGLCFELQSIFKDIAGGDDINPIHPFDSKIMSLSSFAMSVLKYFYLNQYNIKSVLHPYTGYPAKVSSPEHEYLTFLSYTKPEENIKHAFSCSEGQQRFRHILVDGYSSLTRTVYQFHGCQVKTLKMLQNLSCLKYQIALPVRKKLHICALTFCNRPCLGH